MRVANALAALLISVVLSVPAYAYEFHLLNGMVINGELASFKDGNFHINTDFGSVDINSSKLDYIIVNEADGHARAGAAAGPGMEVGGGQKGAEPVLMPAEPEKPAEQQPVEEPAVQPDVEPAEPPQPSEAQPEVEPAEPPQQPDAQPEAVPDGTPQPPAPLEGYSIPPADGDTAPGQFRGNGK